MDKSAINRITAIRDKYKAIAEEAGDNYNLFKVIGLTSEEVRIHSAFLANLLNPQAEHGQKSKFLKLFCEQFDIPQFDHDSGKVTIEKYIGKKEEINGGRIDIDIFDKNGFHIIIENKIYANDQENQLIRYSQYGKKQPKYKLFYLTLHGYIPDEKKSCNYDKKQISLKEGNDYFLLSYHYDILNWLEHCREKAATKPLLREGISHYINLIKYLTNQNTNYMMNQEIIKEFLKPENVQSLANIKECLVKTQIELQYQFWECLINELKKKGFDISKTSYNKTQIIDYYERNKNNKYYGIEIRITNINDTSFRYGIRIDHFIYGGFTVREGDKKNNKVNNKPEYEEYIKLIKEIDSSYQNNEWWLGWKRMEPFLNFKNLDEETCKNLSKMEETVSFMAEQIYKEISQFKHKSITINKPLIK